MNREQPISSAADTIELHKRLVEWASVAGAGSRQIIGDLAEIHAAAKVLVQCIENLASAPPPNSENSCQSMVKLQAWLYEELADHMDSLKAPLSQVIDNLYDRQ